MEINYAVDITSDYNNVLMMYGDHYEIQRYTYGLDRISMDLWSIEDHDNGWIPQGSQTSLSENRERLYYLQDELGSSTKVIGEDGKTSAHYNYDEFGRPLSFKKFDQNWPGPDNTFGYTGYQYDVTAELYYAQARYYNPNAGRFISEDPWEGDIAEPNTLTPYPYVLNNPLKYIDPLGLKAYFLQQGDKNEDVERLQKVLGALGYFQYEGGNTGYFGDVTKGAVWDFQDAMNIGQDGTVDSETIQALNVVRKNAKTSPFLSKEAKQEIEKNIPLLNASFDKFKKQNGASFTGCPDKGTSNSNINDIIKNIEALEQLSMKYNGSYSDKQQVMAFIRRKYDGFKWSTTAGGVDDRFVVYVKKNNLDLFNYFSDGGSGAELIDPVSNVKIDFLHMVVSANAIFHKTGFPLSDTEFNDLAGWAGDLQQAIGDLQQYQKDNKIADNLNDLTSAAKLVIADKNGKFKGFSIKDMLADVDAYNIGVSLNSSSKLSEVLRDYYSNGVNNRYSSFVNNIGGIDTLQKRTDSYTTNASGPVRTDILKDFKITKITDNQRKALNVAFMYYIKSNMEK